MQVLFCHGLESGPWGRKSIALRDAGLEVIAPDGRGQDLAPALVSVVANLRPVHAHDHQRRGVRRQDRQTVGGQRVEDLARRFDHAG